MQKILLIDDAEDVQFLVEQSLHSLPVSLDTAFSGVEALEKVNRNSYQLLLVDLLLPDSHGFDLFLKIRGIKDYEQIPVIFLTSNDDVSTVVSAFSLGADDFISKPFRLLELRARVERRLRRAPDEARTSAEVHSTGLPAEESERVRVGDLTLHIPSQRVMVEGSEELLPLSPREFKILLLLSKHPDRIFSRKSILENVWGSEVNVTNRTVDAHICYLRKKLNKYSPCIESVSGEGYRFKI